MSGVTVRNELRVTTGALQPFVHTADDLIERRTVDGGRPCTRVPAAAELLKDGTDGNRVCLRPSNDVCLAVRQTIRTEQRIMR